MSRGLVDELQYNDIGNEVRWSSIYPVRPRAVDFLTTGTPG